MCQSNFNGGFLRGEYVSQACANLVFIIELGSSESLAMVYVLQCPDYAYASIQAVSSPKKRHSGCLGLCCISLLGWAHLMDIHLTKKKACVDYRHQYTTRPLAFLPLFHEVRQQSRLVIIKPKDFGLLEEEKVNTRRGFLLF